MSTAMSSSPENEMPARQSFLERLIGVFVSPGETFADIARSPDFIAPLVIMVILTAAGTELFLWKIGLEPVVRYAIEHSSRGAQMTPDQIDQALKIVPIQTIITHILGPLYAPIICLIDALLALFLIKTIFGQEINFKTAFSVPCYAFLVGIIPALMGMALIFFGDPEHMIVNPNNPAPTTIGFFLNPPDVSKPVLTLASAFDIFTLWFLVLLGIGYSEATGRKVSATTAIFSFFGIWLLWVLVKLGLSFLG